MAGTKPALFPDFALLDVPNGPGGNNNVIEPTAGKKDEGWDVGERPPRENMNWLHRVTNNWLKYIDGCLDTLITDGALNANFSYDVVATSGLNVSIKPGKYTINGDEVEIATTTVLALGPNSTNFVWLDVNTNTISFADEAGIPVELDGGRNIQPLFRLTTDATVVTDVVDLRSWLQLPKSTVVYADEQTNFEGGVSTDAVEIDGTSSAPTQDLSLGNSFFYRPTAAVTNFTIQDPTNVGSGSPVFTLVIRLDNTGQLGGHSSKFVFVNQPGGTYAFDGNNALLYILSGVYDPTDDEYLCTVTPQAT